MQHQISSGKWYDLLEMDSFEEKQLETGNKGNSKTPVTDNSATVSDYDGAATATDSTSSSPPPLPSPEVSPFLVGEKVITFHWDRPYAARIQRAEFAMRQWKYFIHYPGWKKRWDEWLGPEQLVKFTKENMQMLEEVCKKNDMIETAQCGPQTRPTNSRGPHGKKRKSNDVQKDKCVLPSEKLLLNIQIPHQLKKQLVDDCEFVMHLGKLVLLPRSPTVDGLLSQYSDYRLQKDGMISDSLREILSGLQRYFDKALYALLLYKNEREQYQEVIGGGDVCPSFVYGAEHLLRLFVKLPEMLRGANIEEETLTVLRQELQDFLRFLLKNQSSFFSSTYVDAKPSSAC